MSSPCLVKKSQAEKMVWRSFRSLPSKKLVQSKSYICGHYTQMAKASLKAPTSEKDGCYWLTRSPLMNDSPFKTRLRLMSASQQWLRICSVSRFTSSEHRRTPDPKKVEPHQRGKEWNAHDNNGRPDLFSDILVRGASHVRPMMCASVAAWRRVRDTFGVTC